MSKIFSNNVGAVDRAVRVVLGLGLLLLTVAGPHTLWGLIGIVPLLTAALGFCPAYSLFGIRTAKAEHAASQGQL